MQNVNQIGGKRKSLEKQQHLSRLVFLAVSILQSITFRGAKNVRLLIEFIRIVTLQCIDHMQSKNLNTCPNVYQYQSLSYMYCIGGGMVATETSLSLFWSAFQATLLLSMLFAPKAVSKYLRQLQSTGSAAAGSPSGHSFGQRLRERSLSNSAAVTDFPRPARRRRLREGNKTNDAAAALFRGYSTRT